MQSLPRRDVLRTLAAGAALGTIGGVTPAHGGDASAQPAEGAPARSPVPAVPPPSQDATARAKALLALDSFRPEPPAKGGVAWAHVRGCRAWDRKVYLYMGEDLAGIVTVPERAFGIAAACEAADRPVAVRYWGHDPRSGGGVGRFEGVLLAMDPADLPAAPES